MDEADLEVGDAVVDEAGDVDVGLGEVQEGVNEEEGGLTVVRPRGGAEGLVLVEPIEGEGGEKETEAGNCGGDSGED